MTSDAPDGADVSTVTPTYDVAPVDAPDATDVVTLVARSLVAVVDAPAPLGTVADAVMVFVVETNAVVPVPAPLGDVVDVAVNRSVDAVVTDVAPVALVAFTEPRCVVLAVDADDTPVAGDAVTVTSDLAVPVTLAVAPVPAPDGADELVV
jgi:hypothetical protein